MAFEDLFSQIPVSVLAAAFAILVVGYLIGKLSKALILRFAEKSGIQRKVRFGLEKEAKKIGFNIDIVYILALLIKYSIYAVTIFVVMDMMQIKVASIFLEIMVSYIPQMLGAFIIILAGAAIIEVLADLTKFWLRDVIDDAATEAGMFSSLSTHVASFVRYFLYAIVFIMALMQLGFKAEGIMALVLSIGFVIIATAAVLFVFSTKDQARNMGAGAYLKNSKHFSEGDTVKIGEITGRVEKIGQVSTTIKDAKGRHHIPNSRFLKEGYTVDGKR